MKFRSLWTGGLTQEHVRVAWNLEPISIEHELEEIAQRLFAELVDAKPSSVDGPGTSLVGFRFEDIEPTGKPDLGVWLDLNLRASSYRHTLLHDKVRQVRLADGQTLTERYGEDVLLDPIKSPLPRRPQLAARLICADGIMPIVVRSGEVAIAAGKPHLPIVGGLRPDKHLDASGVPNPFVAMYNQAEMEMGIRAEELTALTLVSIGMDAERYQPCLGFEARTSLTFAQLIERQREAPDKWETKTLLPLSEMPAHGLFLLGQGIQHLLEN